jgi:hypothetical protein
MTPRILAFALAALALAVASESALAQGPFYAGSSDNPIGPTVSPYLNLLNGNQFGVTNYQSLVRPLIDQGSAINRQGNTLNRLQQQVGAQSAGGGYGAGRGGTGHPTYFMFYSHFYSAPPR